MYAVTSPEGAAAILFRDRERAPEVAEALGVAAMDLLELGVIDVIVPEPVGGAQCDPRGAVRLLEPALRRALAEASAGRGSSRRDRRERRIRDIGRERTPSKLRKIGGAIGSTIHRRGNGEPSDTPVAGGPAKAAG